MSQQTAAPTPTDKGAGMAVFNEPVVGHSQGTPAAEPSAAPEQPAAQPAAQPSPAAGSATGLTPDQMAEILKKAGIGQQPAAQPAAQQQQQWTQEDFDRAFNVAKIQPADIVKLRVALANADDGAEAASIMQNFITAAVKQAVTMAKYQTQLDREELEQRFTPALTYAQERRMAAAKEEFFTKFPDLKGFEPITEKVVAEMQAQGWKGGKDEAFAEVEKRTRELLKAIPGLQIPPAQPTTNGVQAPQTKQSGMSTLLGGGQGAGSSSKPAGASSKRSGMELFE